MAERLAAADPAVDELRRKARRRLVGAIVLALAAAVILPMLLEKEPKPLGEDVAVRIPPIDEGKFVNRLSPATDTAKPATEGTPPATTSPAAPASAPNGGNAAPATPQPTPPAAAAEAPAKESSPTVAAPAAAPAPDVASKAEPKPVTAVERKPETATDAKAASAAPAKARSGEGFVVQLAAFSDDKGANALASKLKRNGYPAYTESVQTSRGTLYRVRVGGYPSRDAAADARNRLKGDGYAGIVAAAH